MSKTSSSTSSSVKTQRRLPFQLPLAILICFFATASLDSENAASLRGLLSPAPNNGTARALPEGIEVSSHDNYLYFTGDSVVVGMECQFGDYSVTDGQPFNSTLTCGVTSDGKGFILIHAGRRDSVGPANFFKQGFGQSNMLNTYLYDQEKEPSQSSFAFIFT